MEQINVQVNLYSTCEALEFLKEHQRNISGTWLRKLIKSAKLKVYHIGKSDFFTEADLFQIANAPRPRRGPKSKKTKEYKNVGNW
jgi:hypothetical protein